MFSLLGTQLFCRFAIVQNEKLAKNVGVPGSNPVPVHRGETGALEPSSVLRGRAAKGLFQDLVVFS